MAGRSKGFGVETGDGVLLLGLGAAAFLGYQVIQTVKGPIDAATAGLGGAGAKIGDSFGNIGSSIGKTLGDLGDTLGSIGHDIDLTDPMKYDWLAGPHGLLAGIGDNLGAFRNDVSQDLSSFGSSIDVTDPNSNINQAGSWVGQKFDWGLW